MDELKSHLKSHFVLIFILINLINKAWILKYHISYCLWTPLLVTQAILAQQLLYITVKPSKSYCLCLPHFLPTVIGSELISLNVFNCVNSYQHLSFHSLICLDFLWWTKGFSDRHTLGGRGRKPGSGQHAQLQQETIGLQGNGADMTHVLEFCQVAIIYEKISDWLLIWELFLSDVLFKVYNVA